MHIWGESDSKNMNVGVGFLTRDFLALSGAIMKRADITAAYLVNTSDTVGVGDRIKPATVLNIAVYAKNTSVMSPAKKEAAQELISMLLKRNFNIETNQGNVLTEKEFKEITKKLSAIK